jgi:hypothetical protein
MKKYSFLIAFLLLSSGLFAQSAFQVGVALMPEYDYVRGIRLNFGYTYNVRLGVLAEFRPVERFGVRAGLIPNFYGARYEPGQSPFGNFIDELDAIDMDLLLEGHFYAVSVNQITVEAIGGLLYPGRLYNRVFSNSQGLSIDRGFEPYGLEFLVGAGATWQGSGRAIPFIELVYRRGLDAFGPNEVANLAFRLGVNFGFGG